jgi:hypothetical protein
VRRHIRVGAGGELPADVALGAVCALSALANALMTDAASLGDIAERVGPQAGFDPSLAVRAAERVRLQLADA